VSYAIKFDRSQAIGLKPWTELFLLDLRTRLRIRLTALADTGADITHIPEVAAQHLGLSLATAQPVTIQTAGGAQPVQRMTCDVQVFGLKTSTTVDFSSSSLVLLGRNTMFEPGVLAAIGFDPTALHLKLDDAVVAALRLLKATGLDDPDLDLFLAVLDRNFDALNDALARGADVNITDAVIIMRYL
jgi:hypothetical protein